MPAAVAQARRLVARLLDTAEMYRIEDEPDIQIVLLRCAATVATQRFLGTFSSPRIETRLGQLSAHHVVDRADGRIADDQPQPLRGVVHILSVAWPTGGHTRLVYRWIESQSSVRSNVVVCAPAGDEPMELREAVRGSGGRIVRLQGTTLDRALSLRRLVSDADLIILSAHEDDVIPTLALSTLPERPPTLLINHADHRFWLGTSIVDAVASLRPSGDEITRTRRGVRPDACCTVPIPLGPADGPTPAARARVVDDPSSLVLLTVARGHKFDVWEGTALPQVLAPLLRRRTDVSLVVVGGQADDDVWYEARQRFPGRIVVAGDQLNVSRFYQSADVYLDSYPWPSATSALEAAAHGLPVVGLELRGAVPLVLNDTPGLAGTRMTDERSYLERVEALLDDARLRRDEGQRLADQVAALHRPPSWVAAADSACRLARALAAHRREAMAPGQTNDLPQWSEMDSRLARYLDDREGSWPVWWQIVQRLGDVRDARSRAALSLLTRPIHDRCAHVSGQGARCGELDSEVIARLTPVAMARARRISAHELTLWSVPPALLRRLAYGDVRDRCPRCRPLSLRGVLRSWLPPAIAAPIRQARRSLRSGDGT